MPDIVVWLSQYIEFFPIAAFFCLLLAGLNFPISEDLIIITGALVCQENPSLLVPIFAAIFTGVIISDYFPYYLGKYIRKGTIKFRFAVRLSSSKKVDRMHHYLEKYGIFTFIVCRFIPFGIRNTLFLTSGFFGLRLRRFALYDVTAAAVSVSTLFFLTYYFGESIKKPLQAIGIVLFALIISTVGFVIFRIIRSIIYRRKESHSKTPDTAS
ncbi:MAG: DedA family protein [Treponema sp.]|jgi:membrane protein DedA with SNARE-associated domain|nr:DedA family protein [Treponema sp.]